MSIADSIAVTHEVRDTCLCLRAQKAARSMARRFDAALRPFRLSSGQFTLLNAINQESPPGMAELAALLGADRTTLTAAVKPLTRRGLVAVVVDAADRRGRRLSLTHEGRTLLEKATPVWRTCHQALEGRLGPGAAERLLHDLEALGV
ncbi:MAG TPA: MarR family winged helix-turn-helix transcriptional regulator [Caulobacteraceae bacterium]|jgi:DNA-binding MarR family transcriptional regulator